MPDAARLAAQQAAIHPLRAAPMASFAADTRLTRTPRPLLRPPLPSPSLLCTQHNSSG